jgi:hypothetical protein
MAGMKRPTKLRTWLLTPLIYLAALILLLEDWLWDLGLILIRRIVAWPPLKALEQRIVALAPYPALCVFALPALLLFPVKLIALMAMSSGHVALGLAVIVAAKVGGAAIVARLYSLTRPSLLKLAWFARLHNRFMDFKRLWVGRLKATAAYRRVRRLAGALRTALARLRGDAPRGVQGRNRLGRTLRRLIARWLRARRR